jgi:hypothetical protein
MFEAVFCDFERAKQKFFNRLMHMRQPIFVDCSSVHPAFSLNPWKAGPVKKSAPSDGKIATIDGQDFSVLARIWHIEHSDNCENYQVVFKGLDL